MGLIYGEYRDAGLDLDTAGQYGPLQLDEDGNLKVKPCTFTPPAGTTLVRKRVALTENTDGGVLWNPAEGERFVCTRITVSASAAGSVIFFDTSVGEGV